MTTTIATLAAENGVQPYELAAYLGLGASYDSSAVLDEATEADYRSIIEAVKDVRLAAARSGEMTVAEAFAAVLSDEGR